MVNSLPQALFRAGLSLTLWLVAACSDSSAPAPPPPVAVETAAAIIRDVPIEIAEIGAVEAIDSVALKSRVEGELTQIHFREGEEVEKGQLLFSIDSRPFETTLLQARAALERDAAQAALSKIEAERYKELFEKGVGSNEQYDDRRARAEADRAIVRGDEATVERARLDVEYCSIRSPLGGRTGALGVDQGNLVKPNDTVLVVIDQLAPIYVRFAIPEQKLPEVRRRMAEGQLPVRATPDGDEGPPEPGILTFLDRAVDPSTGTIMLKALFENSSRRLWPGEFVNVVLRLGERSQAIVVPEEAVQAGQEGSQVFVVDAESRAELRKVAVGPRTDGQIVIEQGLRQGEIVVTDGQLMLAPGSRVTPRAQEAKIPTPETQP